MEEAISCSCCKTFLVDGKAVTWCANGQLQVISKIPFKEKSFDACAKADLVVIIYQKKGFGIVLIHNGQQQGLKDRSGQSWNTDMALFAKDRIKDMEAPQACVLQRDKKKNSNIPAPKIHQLDKIFFTFHLLFSFLLVESYTGGDRVGMGQTDKSFTGHVRLATSHSYRTT